MSEQADALLNKACQRHGGLACFQQIRAIELHVEKFGGVIPRAKGLGMTCAVPSRVVVNPNALSASFEFKPGRIVYDRGAIEADGKRIEGYRSTFGGFRKLRFWSNADLAYFLGYALVNYFRLPFGLRDLPLRLLDTQAGGLAWLEAEFPRGADTHCRIQRFGFDSSGLLVRHDYTADILGSMCTGAHFSRRYRSDLPVPIAEQRVVKVRFGPLATPIVVLSAKFTVAAFVCADDQ